MSSRAIPTRAFWRVVACALAGVAACPAGVQAASPRAKPAVQQSEAEDYANRAVERFKAKDFEVAAKLFMQAYARSPRASLVFNAARAYEEAGKPGDAASLFRLYMTISQDADGIVEARSRLKALEARGSTPAPATVAAPAPAPLPVALSREVTPVSTDQPVLRWAATAGAVAALVTGVFLLAAGRSASEAANALPVHSDGDAGTYNSRYDSAQRQWGIGIGLTVVGAGLGAWATWLHLHAKPGQAGHASLDFDAGRRVAQWTVRF